MKPQSALRSLFLGGLLPVVAFALVENYYGTVGGLVAGIAFGIGELAYEFIRFGKVQGITIVGNLLVIVLGGLSLLSNNAVFFKLQPAVLVFAFAGLLIGSSLLGKPFLVAMSRKQMPNIPEAARLRLAGLNLRLGFFMIGLGALSTYAAYFWSTATWAFFKGVGTPILLFAYMGVEVLVMRLGLRLGGNRRAGPEPHARGFGIVPQGQEPTGKRDD